MTDRRNHLVVIDGFSFLFRAYHAVRVLTRSDGLPTNALYGFSQMLIKVVNDLRPDLCVVALDSESKNFRYDIYPAYKANRSEMDEAMKAQMPYFETLIKSFDIAVMRAEGFEADDIIATLVNTYKHDYDVTIVSSDKDLMQLIDTQVVMLDTMKNKVSDSDAVMEKFGVLPDKVIEVQALIGDSSDNVPGVPGIGPKTAAQLINDFKDLDGIYSNIEAIEREKLRNSLIEHKDNAFTSRELVTLRKDVPLPQSKEELRFHPDLSMAQAFLEQMEFHSLAQRVGSMNGDHLDSPSKAYDFANAALRARVATPQQEKKVSAGRSLSMGLPVKARQDIAANSSHLDTALYETVTDMAHLERYLAEARRVGMVAFDTETTDVDVRKARLVGFSLATEAGKACYVPLCHEVDMLSGIHQLDKAAVLLRLKEVLEDENIVKIAQNVKYDFTIMQREGITIRHFEDTMLMSYCLDAGKNAHNMDTLAQVHLGISTIPYKEVAGVGQKQVTFDQVDIPAATRYAAEDADITLRLYQVLHNRLQQPENEAVRQVYEALEKPLVSVLAQMEETGVKVNESALRALSGTFSENLEALEAAIHNLAGTPFNINSPKQLGEVLFDRMGLTVKGRRPKSTNVEVMDILAEEGHEIATKVLEFRQISKLKSTYSDALVTQIDPFSHRVHTSYNQSGAATGRLSSSDPNLQNIPVRTALGRKIRQAFIPKEGFVFLSADYSQIELRLLAHTADVAALKEAFQKDADIHRYTAHMIFDVPEDAVTADQRRVAKIINFGIVYGMGAHSLAKQIDVSAKEASAYIENYFHRYDGVRQYMEKQKEEAHKKGYISTLYGRRLWVPMIHSSNGGLRANAERVAINAPLQGSNADIIKKAMIDLYGLLEGRDDIAMLLQVHDELVFEVRADKVEEATALVTQAMENAVTLSVPLKVGVGVGANWDAAH